MKRSFIRLLVFTLLIVVSPFLAISFAFSWAWPTKKQELKIVNESYQVIKRSNGATDIAIKRTNMTSVDLVDNDSDGILDHVRLKEQTWRFGIKQHEIPITKAYQEKFQNQYAALKLN